MKSVSRKINRAGDWMIKTTPSFLAYREDWGLKVPAFEREGRTARLPITAVHFYFSHSSSVPKHYQDVKNMHIPSSDKYEKAAVRAVGTASAE